MKKTKLSVPATIYFTIIFNQYLSGQVPFIFDLNIVNAQNNNFTIHQAVFHIENNLADTLWIKYPPSTYKVPLFGVSKKDTFSILTNHPSIGSMCFAFQKKSLAPKQQYDFSFFFEAKIKGNGRRNFQNFYENYDSLTVFAKMGVTVNNSNRILTSSKTDLKTNVLSASDSIGLDFLNHQPCDFILISLVSVDWQICDGKELTIMHNFEDFIAKNPDTFLTPFAHLYIAYAKKILLKDWKGAEIELSKVENKLNDPAITFSKNRMEGWIRYEKNHQNKKN